MTDDRLREAERVYQETGDVSAEARLLLERVRAGLLALERLELAGTLDYEPAVLALGRQTGPRSHSMRDVLERLERFPREVTVRALLAAARAVAARWVPHPPNEAALAASEAWLACPCDDHRAALEPTLVPELPLRTRLVVDRALGREPQARHDAWPDDSTVVAESAQVAALRRALVVWALAPHEPPERRTHVRGELLELRIGSTRTSRTFRLLVESERITFGGGSENAIVIRDATLSNCQLERTAEGVRLELLSRMPLVYVNEERVSRAPLATGDVIGLGRAWIEVHVLTPPCEADVARARSEADRLLARFSNDPERIEIAAAAGHRPALLAATRSLLTVRLAFDLWLWVQDFVYLPTQANVVAALALAREVEPLWTRAFATEAAFRRGLDAGSAWLSDPSEKVRNAVVTADRDLVAVLERHGARIEAPVSLDALDPIPPTTVGLLAGSVLRTALRAALGDARWLRDAARAACDAGVPIERVRPLIEEALLRWALGEGPG